MMRAEEVVAGSLPQRLARPRSCWTRSFDVVVVGSGVAGLSTALGLRGAGSILLVTKGALSAGSTHWAQGGVAAALGSADSPEQHLMDTLVAGAGLCDEEAVRVLVNEAPGAIRELVGLGAAFDRTEAGELALTREGGHHRDRIVHAGGDATGAEIQRALVAAVRRSPDIHVLEHAMALDVLPGSDGGVAGLTLHAGGPRGGLRGVGEVRARAVVLASGGLGQVFSATTNPPVSTGDGLALALRAGAAVRDLEFVQFHPTVLWRGAKARGQQPLISEAVRGEGAVLVDDAGAAFMQHEHDLADLAPRDVVAQAVLRTMQQSGTRHVWLDARSFGAAKWERRFPTILASCRAHGIDPVTEPIPVAPAAHFASGGVATDLHGQSSVPGLFACGEAASTGVHGANRLGSNSLLEGLVFSRRIAAHLEAGLPRRQAPVADQRAAGVLPGSDRARIQEVMTRYAGVLRSGLGLRAGADALARPSGSPGTADVAGWEATNLHTLGSALIRAARTRTESRGAHWRQDFPERDDQAWSGRLRVTLEAGQLHMKHLPSSIPTAHVGAAT